MNRFLKSPTAEAVEDEPHVALADQPAPVEEHPAVRFIQVQQLPGRGRDEKRNQQQKYNQRKKETTQWNV
jgi:hypothetical protein